MLIYAELPSPQMSALWRFVKRHRRKFFFLGLVSAGYMTYRFFRSRRFPPEDPKLAEEFFQFARQHHHFEATLQNSHLTSASLFPQLAESVGALMDTKSLLEELRGKQSANRTAVWQTLKVRVVTKILFALYSACLLTTLVHVQLSVLGGYMFLRSASHHRFPHSREQEEEDLEVLELSEGVKMAYLSSWQHVLESDVKTLGERLGPIAESVVGNVGLQEVVSLRRLDSLLHEIRLTFEKQLDACARIRPVTKRPGGPADLPISEQAVLSRLMRETQELIDCNDFLGVYKACLDSAFSSLLDLLAEHFHRVGRGVTDSGVAGSVAESHCERHVNIYDVRIPFAKVVPLVDNVANGLLTSDADSQFNRDLFNTDVLKAFSRNIYDTFSRKEPR